MIFSRPQPKKIDIGGGAASVPTYFNVGLYQKSDLVIDLEKKLLPFYDNSVDSVVCMSTIMYFTRKRTQEIIDDIYRVTAKWGIVRFGVPDINILTKKFVEKDKDFFFEERALDQQARWGKDRYPGETMCDKFTNFFYGFAVDKEGKHHVKSMYDYETLELMFKRAGFRRVEPKAYRESQLVDIEHIDNRPEQMFFLEAVKI